MTSGVELKESEAGIAMSFPATDSSIDASSSSPNKIPRRIRRRLSEFKGSPTTAEDIEAKLKEAEFRRQQFHELLSSKARPKPRSPQRSPSQEMEHAQRLEAKLYAAEQKRLSIIEKARMRLAKLDELRQAAKSGVESRFEKERDELGLKVESRVQQAEANRLLILKIRQQKAAKKERTAQSLMRRRTQESKYKECVRAAIHQKRTAAERKRLGLLEAERSRARARLLRVQRAADSVYSQRETERMRMKDELEDRLLRAKRQRAEYLKLRKGSHCSPSVDSKVTMEPPEFLARKLSRCWKQFVETKGTTYSLARAFATLNLNERSVKSMPFEQLALLIESEDTLQAVESLMKRLETRLRVQRETAMDRLSSLDNIDHLLMRVATPRRRSSANNRSKGARRRVLKSQGAQSQRKLPRYPVRVVLCAYMVLGHPDAVLSGKGEHDSALSETAIKFVQELESLIEVILVNGNRESTSSQTPVTFRSQLENFDKAWCSYLYSFVSWKIKDARLLEEDLVRAACQLELSMMQTCKVTPEGDQSGLTHDMKAVQKQVMEDQKLLKAKVLNLSGGAGIGRMETALSNMRSKYFKSQETGSPMTPPVAHIASPSYSGSEDGSPVSFSADRNTAVGASERASGVARALFKEHDQSGNKEVEVDSSPSPVISEDARLGLSTMQLTDNELMVNEIVHEYHNGVADSLDLGDEDQSYLKVKVKETMEKAFWDGVMESINQEQPDFGWVLKLVTEVRDELCEMSPSSWKQEISDTIDVEILSQVLQSGDLDMNYLGKILEFALVILRKLAAPANDEDLKLTHQSLMGELAEISQSGNTSSFVMALVRGLRFVLQQIQSLKKEISRARIKMIEPLIKGPAGLDYLQKAFSNRYGPASDASTSLPLTREWLASIKPNAEQEWADYVDSLSTLVTNLATYSQGLPSVTLRSGGSVSMAARVRSEAPTATVDEQPECEGERIDLLIRLSLLELVCKIEGVTPQNLPETLKLNFARLRAVQSEVQKIINISTSMLVLRQTLLAQNLVTNSLDMENIISRSAKRLSELLDTNEEVGILEIVETVVDVNDDYPAVLEKLQADKDVVANMLTKSLQSGDVIFTRVSRAIYSALRGVVLGGSGNKGKQLAEAALRRVGAAFLMERVVKNAEVLIVVATVSGHVHGAWYDQLLKNM